MMVITVVSGLSTTLPGCGLERLMEKNSSPSKRSSSSIATGILRVPFPVNVRVDNPVLKKSVNKEIIAKNILDEH